jgi:hypothetical protein
MFNLRRYRMEMLVWTTVYLVQTPKKHDVLLRQ